MAAIRIVGPNDVDPVEFVLPTEDGASLSFTIKPLDYQPRSVLTEYKTWLKKNNRIATEDDGNLKLIELALAASGEPSEVFDTISTAPPAVATQIIEALAAKAGATVGKS